MHSWEGCWIRTDSTSFTTEILLAAVFEPKSIPLNLDSYICSLFYFRIPYTNVVDQNWDRVTYHTQWLWYEVRECSSFFWSNKNFPPRWSSFGDWLGPGCEKLRACNDIFLSVVAYFFGFQRCHPWWARRRIKWSTDGEMTDFSVAIWLEVIWTCGKTCKSLGAAVLPDPWSMLQL